MASEAVLRIKEAEDKAKEVIRRANENAKQIVTAAQKAAEAKRSEILKNAHDAKAADISQAALKAEKKCEALLAEGARTRQSILAPEPAKLAQAVDLIVKRMVSVSGNP